MRFQLQKSFAAACLLVCGVAPVQAANFTRSYLEGKIDEYLNALVAHDHSRLSTTPNVTYVENSQHLSLGAGEWKVAGSLGVYRHTWSDPKSQQVATITTLKENGVRIIYIVRLKIEDDGKISEIETQITRDSIGAERYENMTIPEAVWLETVPEKDRISRAKLIEQTNKYYIGMENNDPKGDYSFFHKDCDRLEDGLKTTNRKDKDPYGHSNDTAFTSLGCEAQFQTGFLGFVTKIRDRRYPVVDEERQAVFAITLFDHNGTVRALPSVNGTSSPIPPYFDVPRTLAASEGFRLRGEKLYRIEMTLTEVPYGQATAFYADGEWDPSGPGTNVTIADPCDAKCLENAALLVLKGMRNKDLSTVPLANCIRYSENGQRLALDDGLWRTLGNFSTPGIDDYAGVFSDDRGMFERPAVYWGLIHEHSTPGVLMLSVNVYKGQIFAIDAWIVRAESRGARGGTVTLMRPPLPVEWDGSPLGKLKLSGRNIQPRSEALSRPFMELYLNALKAKTSEGVQMYADCTRRDNGFQANETCHQQLDGKGKAPNGLFNWTTEVRDAHTHLQDDKKGVTFFVAMIDYPGTTAPQPLRETEKVPGTYLVMQLVRFNGNSILSIEGFVKWMQFGYKSAFAKRAVYPERGCVA